MFGKKSTDEIEEKGKKFLAICDVIKWDDAEKNDYLVHKYRAEDFNSLTQLIVHESQEALFYMNGEALDLFKAGRYTLETQNIPLIGKILRLPTGGKNPFHCEVYYINKTEQMSVKWGTDSKIEFIEPKYNFPICIGACGEMSLRVADSRKLLLKVVGNQKDLTVDEAKTLFKAMLVSKVKDYIANYIKENLLSIFEVDSKLVEMSNEIKQRIKPEFDEYGIELTRFFITTIAKPEDDTNYQKFRDLFYKQYTEIAQAKLDAEKEVIASEARATARRQESYTYQQEKGFEVADKVAENQAQGQYTNVGVGLGMMSSVGGTIAGAVQTGVSNALGSISNNVCPVCGKPVDTNAKFCSECGAKLK